MDDIRNLEENRLDENVASSLRPQQINDFVGQTKLLDNLKIFIWIKILILTILFGMLL